MAKSEGVSLGVALVKLLFTLVKGTLAWMTCSLSLIVESLHSAANVMTSLGVWWSLRVDRQRAEGALEEQEVALQRGAAWETGAEGEYRDWRTQRYVNLKNRWEKKIAVVVGLVLMIMAGYGLWISLNRPDVTQEIFRSLGIGQWTETINWVVPVILLFLGLLTYFISRMEQQVGAIEGQTDFAAGSVRAKLDALGCFLVAGVFALRNISDGAIDIDVAVAIAIAAVLLLQGLEIIVSAMMSQFEEQRIADFQEWDAEAGVGRLALGRLLSGSGWLSFVGFLSRGVSMQTGQQRPLRFLYRHLPAVLGIALGVFLIQSCFFVVQPQEVAFIERLGEALGVEAPTDERSAWKAAEPLTEGLHVKLPWPIDNVVRIGAHEVRSQSFGFHEPPKNVPFIIYEPQFHDVEVPLITRPPKFRRTASGMQIRTSAEVGYLIVITLRVQYRIGNVADYYAGTRDPDEVLDTETNYLLLTWARRKSIDELLTMDRDVVTSSIKQKLNERLDALNTGLKVNSVIVLWIHPPVSEGQPPGGQALTVAKAYQAVPAAREDYKRRVLEAVNDGHKILPKARADAAKILERARAFRETTGLRSDLVILKPVSRLGTVLGGIMLGEEQLLFRLHREPKSLLPADDGPIGIARVQFPNDPKFRKVSIHFPGAAEFDPGSGAPLADGDRVQLIPRGAIVEKAPIRGLDLLLMKDGSHRIGRIVARIEESAKVRFMPHGSSEIIEIDGAAIESERKSDLLTVRPASREVECRILNADDPEELEVQIDYEYKPRRQGGKLPRVERIHRSRIERIVRGGTEGRLSMSQGTAAAFKVLAKVYNEDPAYRSVFRERRRQAALREALDGPRKIILGGGKMDVYVSPTLDPLRMLSEPAPDAP